MSSPSDEGRSRRSDLGTAGYGSEPFPGRDPARPGTESRRMTPQTTEAAVDPRLPRTRILKLMGFIVATAIGLAIWNYGITLEFPPANINELGFMVGSLIIY